jgi:hypothetical protein
LSEATPPDIVAGYIVDPEGITADSRLNLRSPSGSKTSNATRPGVFPSGQTPGYHLRSLQDQSQVPVNGCEETFEIVSAKKKFRAKLTDMKSWLRSKLTNPIEEVWQTLNQKLHRG